MTSLHTHPADPLTRLPGLLSMWRFDGDEESALRADGPVAARLEPVGPMPQQVEGGPWGRALRFDGRHQLRLPRAALQELNRGGEASAVTVVAWLRRRGNTPWQFVAGVWDESRAQRQYGLFLNAAAYTRVGERVRQSCCGRVHGHVSEHGGPTPGERVCLTYATGATPLGFDRWHAIAMSFDGRHSRVFVDGRLDALPDANPLPFPHHLHDGGRNGADFTIGANSVARETRNYLEADLAGVAVFARPLAPAELEADPQSLRR